MRVALFFIQIFVLFQNINGKKLDPTQENMKRYASEVAMGDPADLIGTNPHHIQPMLYNDFGRRFVPQYPYIEIPGDKNVESEDNQIVPVAAPPEMVLNIARQSAIIEKSKPPNPAKERIEKRLLRSGEYWNGVWKENVNPKKLLRNSSKSKYSGPGLTSVNVKIMPSSQFYELMSRLRNISPQLVYIINKKNDSN